MRRLLLVLVTVFVPLALRAQALQAPTVFDTETGEPVPLATQAPPTQEAQRQGGDFELVPLQHLAEGSTKLVRWDNSEGLFFQNGAYLVSGLVVFSPGGGGEMIELDRDLLPAQPADLVIEGTLAYAALRKDEGLLVLDVANPAQVEEIGHLPGEDLLAVAVDGDYAYAGRGLDGLAIYNVSDPANPSLANTLDTPGSANGIWVADDRLYVADGNNTSGGDFRIYDLVDPESPSLLGQFEAGAFVTYVTVAGSVAYLTGGFGLLTVDVSNPALPMQLGSFAAGGETTYEVALDGTTAYVAGLAGLFAVDVSDPALPVESQSYLIEGQGLSLATIPGDPLAFLADRFKGLHVVDFNPSADPEQVAFYENAGFSHKAFFDGDMLYVTDLAGRLRILDVGGAINGTGEAMEVGRIDVPPNTQEVLVRDGLAYVTDSDFGGTGLTIVDVSDPASLQIVGGWNSANQAFGLDLVADTLYLANGFSGLVTLDVSDPANVQELDSFSMSSNTVDVALDPYDAVAYAINFGAGMYSLDVSDATSIQQLDAETSWGFLNAVAPAAGDVSQGLTYVADGQLGLRIVDTWNPSDLTTEATAPTSSQARDVAPGTFTSDVAKPLAWVADDFYGARLFNYDFLLGSFASSDRGIGITSRVFDSYFVDLTVLASGETGLYFFSNPISVGAEPEAPEVVLQLGAPQPNPAQYDSMLRYTLPKTGPVMLAVYDLLGRRVATLFEGLQTAGSHEALFETDGLPSGVYVLRLEASGRVATSKVTVVR